MLYFQICSSFFSNLSFCFRNLGGLRSGSYIQTLFQNMITSSFGMKILELNILIREGKNEHVNLWQIEKYQLEFSFKRTSKWIHVFNYFLAWSCSLLRKKKYTKYAILYSGSMHMEIIAKTCIPRFPVSVHLPLELQLGPFSWMQPIPTRFPSPRKFLVQKQGFLWQIDWF